MTSLSLYKNFSVSALLISTALALVGCDDGGSPVYYPPPSTDGGYSGGGSGGGSSGGGSGGSGGGGGIDMGGGGSPSVLLYPYETVYGDICSSSEPTPGCTFSRTTGARIDVYEDPHYNQYGYGSDDLWYVKFDANGYADVYNDLGIYQYTADVSEFAGYLGGTTIGVGTTGFFWEEVSNGTYWLGKNGVLYSANLFNVNYGQAINDHGANEASQTSFASLNSNANKKLIQLAAQKLQKNYGFTKQKSVAIASALNSWAVSAAERGHTTTQDMNKTFKSTFGVEFKDALSAFGDLKKGDLNSIKDLTNRSAAALGLKPHQAQQFVKDMYKRALSQYGYGNLIAW